MRSTAALLLGFCVGVAVPDAPGLDEDDDGISDVLQLGLPPGFLLDPRGDADGDGVDNRTEAGLRSDPLRAGDAAVPWLVAASTGTLTLRWKAQPLLVYSVDESFDLRTWTTVATAVGTGAHVTTFPQRQLLPDGTFGVLDAPTFWRVRVDPGQQPDADEDALDAWEEQRLGTNPDSPDTDGDGIWDSDEVYHGLNPLADDGDREPPTPPTQLAFTPVAGGARLTWVHGSDNLRLAHCIVWVDGQPLDGPAGWEPPEFLVPTVEDREVRVQVQAFDLAGNGSALSDPLVVRGLVADLDGDGLPDRWEIRHFAGDADSAADPDGDGIDNRAEWAAGSDPNDFYNGVAARTERIGPAQPGPDGLLRGRVIRPDGTPWPHAPVQLFSAEGDPPLSAVCGVGPHTHTLRVWSDENGEFHAYVGWPR